MALTLPKKSHRGCRLNDNLDGTFTLRGGPDRKGKSQDSTTAVVVSQAPDALEPIVTTKRPKYTSSRGLRWHDVPASDVSLSPEGSYVQHKVTKPTSRHQLADPSPHSESDKDSDSSAGSQESRPDVGILLSKSGRRYTEWTGTDMLLVSKLGNLADVDWDQMPKQATRWQRRQ